MLAICTSVQFPRRFIRAAAICVDKANGRSWSGDGGGFLGQGSAEGIPRHGEGLETIHCSIYMKRPTEGGGRGQNRSVDRW